MPDPLILGFDTSAAHCAAALLRGDRVVAQRYEEMAKGQAERLMGLLQEMLESEGRSWDDLDAIAVGVGPGNFTGIRIAVAAARGLALSTGVPTIGVSSFEVAFAGTGHPVIRLAAPRGQCYVQPFENGREAAPPRLEDADARAGQRHPVVAVDWGAGVARLCRVARCKLAEGRQPRPAPLYVRAPDAALPRDRLPAILP